MDGNMVDLLTPQAAAFFLHLAVGLRCRFGIASPITNHLWNRYFSSAFSRQPIDEAGLSESSCRFPDA